VKFVSCQLLQFYDRASSSKSFKFDHFSLRSSTGLSKGFFSESRLYKKYLKSSNICKLWINGRVCILSFKNYKEISEFVSRQLLQFYDICTSLARYNIEKRREFTIDKNREYISGTVVGLSRAGHGERGAYGGSSG